jgi:hypothetical protein
MSERLRLAIEQAMDAEIEAQKLGASVCTRTDAVYAGRVLSRDVLRRLRACILKNARLILDNAGGTGIGDFGQRIHATLTELAEDNYDDSPTPEGHSA